MGPDRWWGRPDLDWIWQQAGIAGTPLGAAYLDYLQAALTRSGLAPASRLARLRLPALCCEATGGSAAQADCVAAAWSLLYVAAVWLDKIADDELPGSQGPGAIGPALSAATGLIAGAGLVLADLEALGVAPETARVLRHDFYAAGLEVCSGQHQDVTVPEPTLEQCWQAVEAKSGAFFGLACQAGARLAARDDRQAARFGCYGRQLGALVQIADDLEGLGGSQDGHAGCGDLLATRRWSLPVAYAMCVLPAGRQEALRAHIRAARDDAGAAARAAEIIVASVAVLYLAVEATRRRRQAEDALLDAAPASRARDELLAVLAATAAFGKPQ